MTKPLTRKAEATLRRNLRQCVRELASIRKIASCDETIRLNKYWRSRRARLRAHLRSNDRSKLAHVDAPFVAPEVFTLN